MPHPFVMIDWERMPGFKRGGYWIGQLWIGVKKFQTDSPRMVWSWDDDSSKPIPLSFSNWIGSNEAISGLIGFENTAPGIDCAVMREQGWLPYNCSGVHFYQETLAGALCTHRDDLETLDNNAYCSSVRNFYFICEVFLTNIFQSLLTSSSSTTILPITVMKKSFLVLGNFTLEQGSNEVCPSYGAEISSNPNNIELLTKDLGLKIGEKAWVNIKDSSTWNDAAPANQHEAVSSDNGQVAKRDCVVVEKSTYDNATLQINECSEKLSVFCDYLTVL